MKNLIVASLLLFTGSVFAADPNPVQLARTLQIKDVQKELSKVEGSVGQVAVTFDYTGGMESSGFDVSINLTSRSTKAGKSLKDCEMHIVMIGPKYNNDGSLYDLKYELTREDLRTLTVSYNTCR